MEKKLISLKEASNLLSISYNYLTVLCRKNSLRGVFKIGGRFKVDMSSFVLNFNDNKKDRKISFENLRRYFEAESSYYSTVTKSTYANTSKALKEAALFFYEKNFSKENIYLWIHDLRSSGKADGTIRKYLCGVSKMCEECIKVGILEVNPCKNTFAGLEQKKRTAFLTPSERERLIAVCNEDLADKINFAIETGLRKGEQLGLTWDKVFFKEKEILITETKTNVDRIVPLSPNALKILEKRKHLLYPFIDIKREEYVEALKKAYIEKHITWHDLRRTFGMWCIKGWHSWLKGNMNKAIIGKFLGHLSEKTTSIYAALDTKDLHNLIEQDLYEMEE